MNNADITSLIERMLSAYGPKVALVENYCQQVDRFEHEGERHQDSYHSLPFRDGVDDRHATNFEDRGRRHVGRQVFNVGYSNRKGSRREPGSTVYRSERPQAHHCS